MPWWVASGLANVAIGVIEYVNRTGGYASYIQLLKVTGPFILLANWCLWQSWSGAPSLMTAWVVFSSGNIMIRLATSYWIGEQPNLMVWSGVMMVVGGSYLIKISSAHG